MKSKKINISQRIAAFLLIALLIFGAYPATVFAAESDGRDQASESVPDEPDESAEEEREMPVSEESTIPAPTEEPTAVPPTQDHSDSEPIEGAEDVPNPTPEAESGTEGALADPEADRNFTLEEIILAAYEDGSAAGAMLNTLAGTEDFDAVLHDILIIYYSNELWDQLSAFKSVIDPSAAPMLEQFEAARAERESAASLGYVPGEIIVVSDDSVSQTEIVETAEELNAETVEAIETPSDEKLNVIEISVGDTVASAIEQFEQADAVGYAQPNYLYQPETVPVVNDPKYSEQWHLEKINIPQAWEFVDSVPHEPVTVAVLDTGAKVSHEDLLVNVDASKYIDLSKAPPHPVLTEDTAYHGTFVTGAIAATANNGIGVAGAGSGIHNDIAKVIPANIYPTNDETTTSVTTTTSIIYGINWAVESGARIVNMSFGGTTYDAAQKAAIDAATAKGVLFVCSAGNNNTDVNHYPSDYENCISVIATNNYTDPTAAECKWSKSNYGSQKDISAPGVYIWTTSTMIVSDYSAQGGTSMAAPLVSSVAAMMLSVNPDLTPQEIKSILCETATDLYTPGYDVLTAHGNVNAYAAVKAAWDKATGAADIRITMTKTAQLKVSDTLTMDVTRQPSDNTDTLVWTSSNPKVASVDQNGKISAVSAGTTVITAKHPSGSAASSTVTVRYTDPGCPRVSQNNGVSLSVAWTPVTGTNTYTVYRSVNGGAFQKIATVSTTSYKDLNVKTGTKYAYKVTAGHSTQPQYTSDLSAGSEPYIYKQYQYPSSIRGFVQRTYELTLLREADPSGLTYWTNRLQNKSVTGATLLAEFLLSKEFKTQKLSDEEYIVILYRTVMGREPDGGGKAFWLQKINAGMSRNYILQEFVNSSEFKNMCARYNISAGTYSSPEMRDKNSGVTGFVGRLYSLCLNRKAEAEGLNYWCGILLNKKMTGRQIAENFFFSDEFRNAKHSDAEFVNRLYRCLMNREADTAGRNYWIQMLQNGTDRLTVCRRFANSAEFQKICTTYGIAY